MRQLVIGDIHGAKLALEEALIACGYDYIQDKLIFLGDYVDGWSQSAELVQFLIELQEQSVRKHVFLRGNHDKWCEDWLLYGDANPIWLEQGGRATFDSYVRTAYLVDEKHKTFFRNMSNYYIDGDDIGYVHGGFKSRKGLGNDHYPSDYYWDRDLWELALALDGKIPKEDDPDYDEYYRPNPYRMYRHNEVFIGHTTTNAWRIKPHLKEYNDPNQPNNGPIIVPMNRCNMWNLDTGCGFNGKLTIMDTKTKEYWQSSYTKDLYPKELGRR